MKKTIFTLTMMALSSASFSQAIQNGYLTDNSGRPVKSGFGLCWKASSDFNFSEECGDVKVAQLDQRVTPLAPPEPVVLQPQAEVRYTPVDVVVLFEFDSAQLTQESQNKLNDALKSNQSYNFRIIGHTDSIGSDKYNENLGLKRAQAVKFHLLKNGFNENNIETVTKGETELVVNCKSVECQAPNRRAVITNK